MAHGELCVMTIGGIKMLVLFAVNLDSQNMVIIMVMPNNHERLSYMTCTLYNSGLVN